MRLDGELEGLVAGGAAGGGSAHLAYYPSLDLTIVIASGGGGSELAALERRLARAVFDLPEPGVQDLPIDAAERARYVGAYQIGCTRLDVVDAGEHLELVGADRPRWVLLHQGRHTFVAQDDAERRLVFLAEEGAERAHAVVVDERGVRSVAVRVPGAGGR